MVLFTTNHLTPGNTFVIEKDEDCDIYLRNIRLNFGINLMNTCKIKFDTYYGTVDEIEPMIEKLKIARGNSKLLDKAN